ncbi:MAG: T9SS type A sorting domain-containing protein [Romboutsia sp.]|nr:T9SS type A sorting domain-containing protein [Romboutsia sp.]
MRKLVLIMSIPFTLTLYSQKWENVSSLNENIGQPNGFMCDGKNLLLMSYSDTYMILTKSTDKGKTWFEQYKVETEETFGDLLLVRNSILIDKDYIYTTFWDHRKLAKSIDGGLTFKMIDFGPGPSFYQICMYNRNIGVGMSGSDIFMTTDGWETYDRISTSFSSTYYNPIFINEHTVQFACDRANLIVLVNFDLNKKLWDIVYEFPKEVDFTFLDLKYTRNGLGFLAGLRRNGKGDRATDVMYQSTDYGKSWFKTIDQDVEPQWGFDNVSFNDTLNGFVTGQFGKIMMTNDGGKNWDYVQDLDFYVGQDTSYGPFTTEILWMEDKPYIMSDFRNLYSIDTDYFKIYDKYNIAGKILNNGASVYAPLRIDNLVKFTLDDGSYEFDKMPTKKYTVTPEPSDYFSFSPESIEVDVINSDVIADFESTRKRYDIVGKIDNKINANIDDLKFQIQYKTSNGFLYVLDTIAGLNSANNLELNKLVATENVIIKALDENAEYKVIPSKYNIDLNQDTVLHFEILDKNENFTISGSFKINGKGIENVNILLLSPNPKLTFTDSIGNYRFYNVEIGNYALTTNSVWNSFNLKPKYYEFELLGHKENMDFNIQSLEYTRFSGRVTDKNGNGIPNIRILPFKDIGALFQDTFGVRTRSDGRYSSFIYPKTDDLDYIISLDNRYTFTPSYIQLNISESLDGYDFVIDTVISSVPYRLTKPINIYPNPAKDKINLDLSTIGRQVSSISIFNIDGKLVRKDENIYESLKTFDTSTLIKGTYYIQLDIEGGLIDRYTFVKE